MSLIDSLDEFTRAYLECILFSETDNSDDSGGEPLDHSYSIEDFSEESLKEAIADCVRFQKDNAEDIATIPDHNMKRCDSYGRDHYSGLECAGHDFWFTRNGHGVGFWDRDWISKPVKERLTAACKKLGERWVYVGDDGQLHID